MSNIREKLIEAKNLLQGHILALIMILVIVIGIPVTVYLAKHQQDLRAKATDAGTLVFSPPTPTGPVNINNAFDLRFGINLNPATRITGADVTIAYTNNLRLDTFSKDATVLPEEILNSSNPTVNPITVHYVAVSRTGDLAPRTYVPLGRLTFTAISAGSATITITANQIVAKDVSGTLAIGNATTTYTIAGPTPTPTPAPAGCINGDTIDGNGCVDINDYNTWYSEFTGAVATKTADFYTECNSSTNRKGDGVIDIRDYNIWRREFDASRNRCP